MRLTSRGEKSAQDNLSEEGSTPASSFDIEKTEGQRWAAAAAVAVGLAQASSQKQAFSPLSQGPAGELSPWQAFHRSRQNTPKDN